MPRDTEVPIDLKPLLKRQGFELDDRYWKQQLAVLAQALEKVPGVTSRAQILGALPGATGQVKLIGSRQWFLIQPQIVIFIDNKEVTRMKLTDQITVEVEPGAHTIFGRMMSVASNTCSFVLKSGKTQAFSVSANRIAGGFMIEPLASQIGFSC